jgi:hypothetical protein
MILNRIVICGDFVLLHLEVMTCPRAIDSSK